MALLLLLRRRKKRAYGFIQGFQQSRYAEFPQIAHLKGSLPKEHIDLIVGMDYGKFSRLGVDAVIERDRPRIISIDHHPLQDHRGDVVWVDDSKSSTCEMIYDLSRALKFSVEKDIASYLILGLVSDTDKLSTRSVTPKVMRAIVELMERGGSIQLAQGFLRQWESFDEMKLSARAVLRSKMYPQEKLSISWISQREQKKFGIPVDIASRIGVGVAHELRTIRHLPISLMLVQHKSKKWYGHFRSLAVAGVDLGKIAEKFGGGGHRNAAGFSSTFTRQAITKKILTLLKREK